MSNDLEDYFSTVPEHRKSRLNALHTVILKLFPEIDVSMQYKMPTYRFAGGWVACANQKNYISLYTCGYHHIEPFKQQFPDIKTGKGCINFRDKDPFPLEAIGAVIKHAIEHPK